MILLLSCSLNILNHPVAISFDLFPDDLTRVLLYLVLIFCIALLPVALYSSSCVQWQQIPGLPKDWVGHNGAALLQCFSHC